MRELSRYNGLQEKAAPGTHQTAWELLATSKLAPQSKVLDLAAGNGAFASRFQEAGFQDISVSELVERSYPFPTSAMHQWDLNQDFSTFTEARYNLVTAIEIIEHLDSPLHFLRQIHRLMADQGVLLVTTPNVQSIMSRLKFLLKGELKSFGHQDFIDQRHIHGITDQQMKTFFDIVGFEVVAQTSGGSFYGPLKTLLLKPLYALASFLKGYRAQGDVNIYLVRKSRAKAHLDDSREHYLNVAMEQA